MTLVYCPPPFAKAGDIKSHSSVSLSVHLSVSPSVTKTLTWLISSEVLMIEHWYLACMILVTSPFYWYHVVTLTLTFDLLQGQICCRAGDHNSSNLLVAKIIPGVGFAAWSLHLLSIVVYNDYHINKSLLIFPTDYVVTLRSIAIMGQLSLLVWRNE